MLGCAVGGVGLVGGVGGVFGVIIGILFYFIIFYYTITNRSLEIHVSCHPVLVKKKNDPTNSSSIAACHSV